MSTPTRRGRRAHSAPVAPQTPEDEPVSSTEPSEPAELNPEGTTVDVSETGKVKLGRKPMDEAERQARHTYRACAMAADLLRNHGFTVTEPDGWKNPDEDRLKLAAERAIAALRKAGIDPGAVLG